ncbi:unnamed protein product [Effrenium voratum]|uniref:Uncharacterized protein n=1 Tax=Effrenium voratum TaxID=2562239 RepID=A0AA36JA07_9DINO|nr:unnamed protein product [Effrenium voratum]|eukprot:CAMPEP_0181454694 /NCGR_PEP_ID=MMETSP1110-20121109/30372_1 /TAXON_ID=174948 /ORGANISM="Symbiodinium sp., Strain CCMP421" /LENGTH=250 /DNA_ID=CAMNT_0023579051 /DNA_START=51 /DNA_END=803 /DNA_ORIENTATION=+
MANSEEHVVPRVNAFRGFMSQVCEQVCMEFEREVTQMSEDILMYRGELAKCADLLAYQLGKEKQYHNMLENIAGNTSTLIGKSSELGQKHSATEPLREQMNQLMEAMFNTHKDAHYGHAGIHDEHRQMVESHLMTSAQLQNQAEAVQAELDSIMRVLSVPVVSYTKAQNVPRPSLTQSPQQSRNPQSPGTAGQSPSANFSLGASPNAKPARGPTGGQVQTMSGYGNRASGPGAGGTGMGGMSMGNRGQMA